MTKDTTLADEFAPRLGQKVRIADHFPDSEQWNTEDWYVVGLATELGKKGVNVSVGPEYPIASEGPTDGFWVNRWPKSDDLEWSALQPRTDAREAALREAVAVIKALPKPYAGWNDQDMHFDTGVVSGRYEAEAAILALIAQPAKGEGN